MVVIDMDMPESCDVCDFVKTQDDLPSDDYRFMICNFPHMGEYVSDYIATRHPDCPIVGEIPKGESVSLEDYFQFAIQEMKKTSTELTEDQE